MIGYVSWLWYVAVEQRTFFEADRVEWLMMGMAAAIVSGEYTLKVSDPNPVANGSRRVQTLNRVLIRRGWSISYRPRHRAKKGSLYTSIQMVIADMLASKIEWAVQTMQALQLGLIKLSFVVFFRRIFVTSSRTTFSIISWVVIGLLIAWTTTYFLGFLFACGGHFERWFVTQPPCLGYAYYGSFICSDAVMDFMVILMPIPMVCAPYSRCCLQSDILCRFGICI